MWWEIVLNIMIAGSCLFTAGAAVVALVYICRLPERGDMSDTHQHQILDNIEYAIKLQRRK